MGRPSLSYGENGRLRDRSFPQPQTTRLRAKLAPIVDIPELLARLDERSGLFPHELVREAVARREEVIPHLLAILEDVDRDPEPWLADQQTMRHVWAMYLLALFRETRAYPLLVRIFSRPGEFAFDLAGDVPTQDLGRMLASTCGADPSGMTALIENEQANEYVRSSAMSGMVSLVTTGQRGREQVMEYFLQLFHKLEPRPGAQWDGLACACADLWPREAMAELERAYEEGLVDPTCIEWEEVEEALALGQEEAMKAARRDPLITDLARNMGWMECFHQRKTYDEDDEELDEDSLWRPQKQYPPLTVYRTSPKIGRNDPCPCGSGKKFKKCCLDKGAALSA